MPDYWVFCPESWRLENVQAGLSVVVTALSFITSFILVRSAWQTAAKRATKDKAVPLHSLLSVASLGEVWDVALLLRWNLFTYRHIKILAQCFAVIFFSATAILSGPIARYSSRLTLTPRLRDVPGLLASNATVAVSRRTLEYDRTYAMLDRVNFPRDQLFDFLPDSGVPWVYESKEWNNSWTMDCHYTSDASVALQFTSNCSSAWSQLQGLDDVVPRSRYPYFASAGTGEILAGKVDGIWFFYATDVGNKAPSENVPFNISVALVQYRKAPANTGSANMSKCAWQYDKGPVQSASYSKMECKVACSAEGLRTIYHARPALPSSYLYQVANAYTEYYGARFDRELVNLSPLTVVTPEELARFYQVYMGVKDVTRRNPVSRKLSVNVSIVQISSIFLAVMSLVAGFVILGTVHIGVFTVRHLSETGLMPESKVDWMLQSIEAEDRPVQLIKKRGRKSVTVEPIANAYNLSYSQSQRAEFETAVYGGNDTTTWILKKIPPSPFDDDGGSERYQSTVGSRPSSSKHSWFRRSDADSKSDRQGLIEETELT